MDDIVVGGRCVLPMCELVSILPAMCVRPDSWLVWVMFFLRAAGNPIFPGEQGLPSSSSASGPRVEGMGGDGGAGDMDVSSGSTLRASAVALHSQSVLLQASFGRTGVASGDAMS